MTIGESSYVGEWVRDLKHGQGTDAASPLFVCCVCFPLFCRFVFVLRLFLHATTLD
jgi:hypothetical protein